MRNGRFVLRLEHDPPSGSSDDHGVPVVGAPTSTLVRGNLTMLTAAEARRAEHYGEHLEAAAHVPAHTDVSHLARVLLQQSDNPHLRVPAHLAGTWTAGAVRHGRPLLRVLLRREVHP